jgi:hypothetical protein
MLVGKEDPISTTTSITTPPVHHHSTAFLLYSRPPILPIQFGLHRNPIMAESITPSEATNPVVFFDIALAGKG